MRLVRRLLRLLRTLFRKIRDFLAWVASVVQRIVGPPFDALARVIRRIVAYVWRIVEGLLGAWARVWSRNPEKHDLARPRHLQVCAALATLVLALVGYGTPTADAVGWGGSAARFSLFAIALWLVAFLALARSSSTETARDWTDMLGRLRARTGLVTIERIGAVAAFALLALAPLSAIGRARVADTLVLRIALFVTFLAFLADAYQPRPASAVTRTAPALPPGGPPPEGYESRHFHWHLTAGAVDQDRDFDITVNAGRYRELRETNPKFRIEGDRPRFDEWVIDGVPPGVDAVAATFGAWCASHGWSAYVEVCLAVSFAQHFRYRTDEESVGIEEYWRYPLETLYDGEGDCEDTAILAAAVLRRMGHTVALFVTENHAALAVSAPPGIVQGHYMAVDGLRFYYCETSSAGWVVGELPPGVDPTALRLSLLTPDETPERAAA